MTTAAISSEYYDPDEAIPQNSPMLGPLRPKLEPSPSPPPNVPLPKVSPSPSPGRNSSNRRRKVPPSQGDAVLIHYLDGGKRPEIAAEAGREPLAEFVGEDDGSYLTSSDSSGDEELEELPTMSPMVSPSYRPAEANPPRPGSFDLKLMAAAAFAKVKPEPESPGESQQANEEQKSLELGQDVVSVTSLPSLPSHPVASLPKKPVQQPQARETGYQKPVLQAPITPYTPNNPSNFHSPRENTTSQVLRHPGDITSSVRVSPGRGDLPPIQMLSPKPDPDSIASLPSIRSTLGEQLTEHPNRFPHPQFPISPPGGAPRMAIGVPGGHASPPISPHYSYGQSMPSPAQSLNIRSPYGYQTIGNLPRLDYCSPTETASTGTDPSSTPPTSTSISDRMSIDNMTNPQTGSFICTFPGCGAPPFATQYLLNSHANVHSSARPHYCPVKGCGRAEGGKGFKRKNEMIRHGLVHESPGYVCPFCPDREHKYPRPDNLQRHVRVHHVDKDKDDPMLRDVLSKRPDGPNRGRRRRGVP